jgi:pyruvate dehydrogenase E2 component (dihydrolipoamide acetyltransferase)
MDSGTVVEWLIKPGAVVHRGDVVAIVETDKNDLDVEVFADGTVVELVVPAGEKVSVGTTLAMLAPSRQVAGTLPAAPRATAPPAERIAPAIPLRPRATEPVVAAPHLTSPMLRHLAVEHHIDMSHVHGSGVGGRITRDDIERAEARRTATPRARRLARQHGIDLASLPGAVVSGDDVLRAGPVRIEPTAPAPEPHEPDDQGLAGDPSLPGRNTDRSAEVPCRAR